MTAHGRNLVIRGGAGGQGGGVEGHHWVRPANDCLGISSWCHD